MAGRRKSNSIDSERKNHFSSTQKINHFPGMSEICRKDSLTRNMCRMQKMFPKEYAFYPKAWCLPAEFVQNDRETTFESLNTFIFISVTTISPNTVQRKKEKLSFPNLMSAVKGAEFSLLKIRTKISNRNLFCAIKIFFLIFSLSELIISSFKFTSIE